MPAGQALEAKGNARVATDEQKEAFRQILKHARQQRAWSQRRLADELGVSHSTVAYWERGEGVPAGDNLARLEHILQLEPGTLTRLLGYMPEHTMRREMSGVIEAIMTDPQLGARERELLLALYHQLIQQRADREARKTNASRSGNQQQNSS